MRLADFIDLHRERILSEWEEFAASLGAITAGMTPAELRDHADKMLVAIAADIRSDQTATAQESKAKGARASPLRALTAASIHGTGRHRDGFSLLELTGEFRALRASVLRLWLPTVGHADPFAVDDLIRFNESLDQEISESVSMFSQKDDEARDIFLAMLGHDLRSPMQAIALTLSYFERAELERARTSTSVDRIKRSLASMTAMVNDLLEFSRLQLGGAIPIVRRPLDIALLGQHALDDAKAAHPHCALHIQAAPDVVGAFDEHRLQQAFSNLLNNACQYGARGSDITLSIFRQDDIACADVHNLGPPIAPDKLNAIFNLMYQLKVDDDVVERPRTSIGLGLFIARRIVEAHDGTLTVRSTESEGTTFSVRLPIR
jgi:signal transduction histidine kinase